MRSNSCWFVISFPTTKALKGCVCCCATDAANCDCGDAPTTLKSGASTCTLGFLDGAVLVSPIIALTFAKPLATAAAAAKAPRIGEFVVGIGRN